MDAANPLTTAAPARISRVRPGRRVADRILILASTIATLVGIVVLGSILFMLVVEGINLTDEATDQYTDIVEERSTSYTKSGRTFTVGLTYVF